MESATQKAFCPKMTKDEINRLPVRQYSGAIHHIQTDAAARKAIQELRRERILGFDTETRAAFRKGESYPPALVQLAGARAVYIFQLASLSDFGGLDAIFTEPRIVKTGVSMMFDIRKLRELHPFQPYGFRDLEEVSNRAGIEANALRALAAIVLGFRISKGQQRSNWAIPHLTRAQISYAATDAWVCREVYLRLTSYLKRHPPAPPTPPPAPPADHL